MLPLQGYAVSGLGTLIDLEGHKAGVAVYLGTAGRGGHGIHDLKGYRAVGQLLLPVLPLSGGSGVDGVACPEIKGRGLGPDGITVLHLLIYRLALGDLWLARCIKLRDRPPFAIQDFFKTSTRCPKQNVMRK